MTTIAWDGITLAADSQLNGDFVCRGGVKKVHRVGGDIVACSGAMEHIMAFIAWYDPRSGVDDFPSEIKDFTAFVFQSDTGRVMEYGGTPYPWQLFDAPHATGSGSPYAMGAMLNGANAKQAVKIASQLDDATGGRIYSCNPFG